jgi:hypothetical protein
MSVGPQTVISTPFSNQNRADQLPSPEMVSRPCRSTLIGTISTVPTRSGLSLWDVSLGVELALVDDFCEPLSLGSSFAARSLSSCCLPRGRGIKRRRLLELPLSDDVPLGILADDLIGCKGSIHRGNEGDVIGRNFSWKLDQRSVHAATACELNCNTGCLRGNHADNSHLRSTGGRQ